MISSSTAHISALMAERFFHVVWRCERVRHAMKADVPARATYRAAVFVHWVVGRVAVSIHQGHVFSLDTMDGVMIWCECICNSLRRGATSAIGDLKFSDWSMWMVVRGKIDCQNDREQDLISVASPMAETHVVLPGQRGLQLYVCLMAQQSSKPALVASEAQSYPIDMLLHCYWIMQWR